MRSLGSEPYEATKILVLLTTANLVWACLALVHTQ